jgi:DNA-binding MarR family transcriptional regulator
MNDETAGQGEFSRLVGTLIRSLSLLDRDQKVCCGVTVSQCCTVETLAQRGTLSMNKLSEEMGVAISTMTRVVDILVRDGVVARKGGREDRRRVYVQLTDKGAQLALRLRSCADEYGKLILCQVPPEERRSVLKALSLLNDAINRVRRGDCVCSA